MADRPRPPLADAPDPGKLSSSAGRQSNPESAIHETSGRESASSPKPPGGDKAERSPSGDDFATKTYNLDELNRLRAMSHQAVDADAEEDELDDEDGENSETSRINIEDPQWRDAFSSDPPAADDDPAEEEEDRTTSRMNLRDHAVIKPAAGAPRGEAAIPAAPQPGWRNVPARPEMSGSLGRPGGSLQNDETSPDLEVTAPRQIDDEDSNDEGPTVRRRGGKDRDDNDERSTLRRSQKADFAEERAVFARPPRVELALPVDTDDDPFDDGPTRMRPPSEVVAPPQARLGGPMRVMPDEIDTSTERLPDGLAARFAPRSNMPAPMTANAPTAPGPGAAAKAGPPWGSEGRSSSVPPRVQPGGLARLVSTQPLSPLASSAAAPLGGPVNAPPGGPMNAPPGGPQGVRANTSPSGQRFTSPWTATPVHTPSFGTPALPLPSASPGRQRLIAALVGVALGLVVLFIYGIFAENDPISMHSVSPASTASAVGTGTASALPPALAPAPTVTDSSSAVPMDVAEREAREALSKLREGISACAERNPVALPETAPAVPSSLKLTRPDGYMPKADDWKAPIFLCAKFNPTGPMRYQLQWQSEKPFQEGIAVAWIDSGGDGNPDRAVSFRATLKLKGKIELSELLPIDASHKVIPKP